MMISMSSWLLTRRPLTIPVILYMSNSSISVFHIVLLVRLLPVARGPLPDLAGPAWRLAGMRSYFSNTNPDGGGLRWVSPKKAWVVDMMLPSWFLPYGAYTDPVRLCLPVLLFNGSSLMGCSAIILFKSTVLALVSF